MYLSDGAEEILETMWVSQVEKEAPFVTVEHIKEVEKETHFDGLVTFIGELVEKGLVEKKGEQLTLTQAGMVEGKDMVRRHRLSERLFEDVLQVKGDMMNEAACKMEHILHKGIDENICTLLGHPQICPHGKKIPAGPCCEENRKSLNKLVASLVEAPLNKQARIAYLQTDDPNKLQKLMSMGVLPGKDIRVLNHYPSYVFEVGHSQYAVDQDMARSILVRLL